MTQTLKSKKGVTLVELLAVIVILGIIAAIAVPAIGGLIERQRENAAEQSYEIVMDQAKTYILGEGLVATNTFTLDDLTPGYVESNPIAQVSIDGAAAVAVVEANVQFEVYASSPGVLDARIINYNSAASGTVLVFYIDGVDVLTVTVA